MKKCKKIVSIISVFSLILGLVQMQNVTYKEVEVKAAGESVPTSYDPTAELPAIRNLGSYELLGWAFADTALAEINILKNADEFKTRAYTKDNIDFSERHLAYFSQNSYSTNKADTAYGDGKKVTTTKAYTANFGDIEQSLSSLVRGSAFAIEEVAPYAASGMGTLAETERYTQAAVLHDYHELGEYDGAEDTIQKVKEAILDYGAVATWFYSLDEYYSETKEGDGRYAYHSPYGVNNHSVVIVGWDDNYSKDNFGLKPENDGAWLVRNCKGADWSGDGYFWISYEEPSLYELYSFEMADTTKYGKAYSYTASGDHGYFTHKGKSIVKAANVYKATSGGRLNAVGFRTYWENTAMNVKIYVKDSKMTGPEQGTLVCSQKTEAFKTAGFHMIDLSSLVVLRKGQYFSVVMEMSCETEDVAFIVESGKHVDKFGQTYYHDGTKWFSSTSIGIVGNALIYAYTSGECANTAMLGMMEAARKVLQHSDIDGFLSDAQQKKLEALIAYAKDEDLEQSSTIAWITRHLRSTLRYAASRKLYTTSKGSTAITNADGRIDLYVNGGTSYKINGEATKIGYKTAYAKFTRVKSNVWLNKKKGTTKKALSGKYVIAYTTKYEKPTLNANGTLCVKDDAAQGIVSATMSGNKITIKPKKKGQVYVWILWYPKSVKDQEAVLASQTDCAVARVMVQGIAPSAIRLYHKEDVDLTKVSVAKATCTGRLVPPGGTTTVYAIGTTGSLTTKKSTLKAMVGAKVYAASIPSKYAKYKPYISTILTSNIYTSTIQCDISVYDSIKNVMPRGKTVKIPITICSTYNSAKKATFNLTVGNCINETSFSNASGLGTVSKGEDGIVTVTMSAASNIMKTAYIAETVKGVVSGYAVTDGTTIYRMAEADDFSITRNGGAYIKTSLTAQQKKVSMTRVKGTRRFKITLAKGIKPNITTYFLVFHNGYYAENGKGYQIIKVTTTE